MLSEFFYVNSYRVTEINFLLSAATGDCKQTKTITEGQISIMFPGAPMGQSNNEVI